MTTKDQPLLPLLEIQKIIRDLFTSLVLYVTNMLALGGKPELLSYSLDKPGNAIPMFKLQNTCKADC